MYARLALAILLLLPFQEVVANEGSVCGTHLEVHGVYDHHTGMYQSPPEAGVLGVYNRANHDFEWGPAAGVQGLYNPTTSEVSWAPQPFVAGIYHGDDEEVRWAKAPKVYPSMTSKGDVLWIQNPTPGLANITPVWRYFGIRFNAKDLSMQCFISDSSDPRPGAEVSIAPLSWDDDWRNLRPQLDSATRIMEVFDGFSRFMGSRRLTRDCVIIVHPYRDLDLGQLVMPTLKSELSQNTPIMPTINIGEKNSYSSAQIRASVAHGLAQFIFDEEVLDRVSGKFRGGVADLPDFRKWSEAVAPARQLFADAFAFLFARDARVVFTLSGSNPERLFSSHEPMPAGRNAAQVLPANLLWQSRRHFYALYLKLDTAIPDEEVVTTLISAARAYGEAAMKDSSLNRDPARANQTFCDILDNYWKLNFNL